MLLTERKEIAQALNFGKYPVLTFDLDTNEGSKAVVLKMSNRYGEMRYDCKLQRDYHKKGDGIFYLSTNASMISGDFSAMDALKCAEYANAPVIEPHQEVAILLHSKIQNTAIVLTVKSGHVDPTYSSATVFEHLAI